MTKPKVIGFYAGPGTGKSTTATAVFSELKQLGINCEYISEYAKDATWERRGPKVFEAQEYIFGKQHFKMSRVSDEVDIIVTDSPILLTLIYMPKNFSMPSLVPVVKEAYALYDNLDVFLERNKPYNPKGRNQTLEQAIELDGKIKALLSDTSKDALTLPFGRKAIAQTIIEAGKRWGAEIPELNDYVPSMQPRLTKNELPFVGERVLTDKGMLANFDGASWRDSVFGKEIEAPRWWLSLW